MKVVFCISLFIVLRASSFAQYIGGIHSGAYQNILPQATCTLSNAGFIGGGEDGHSSSILPQTTCVLSTAAFTGGTEDGFSSSILPQTTCVLSNDAFTGGVEDGFSSNILPQTTCVLSNAAFTGGIEDGFGWRRYSVCLDVLPIELLTFTAKLNINKVDLVWETATETNNNYFTIEKTQDMNTYEKVAVVKGAGNSTQNIHYDTVDFKPYTGVSYYRLKQTDFNGDYKYSDLVPINYTKGSMSLFPNPKSNDAQLTLNYSTDADNQVSLIILDAMGNQVSQKSYTAKKGINNFNVFVPDLAAGIYFFQIIDSGKRETVKMIINK